MITKVSIPVTTFPTEGNPLCVWCELPIPLATGTSIKAEIDELIKQDALTNELLLQKVRDHKERLLNVIPMIDNLICLIEGMR